MAFLAGATDVYGLARLHDLFVSFMSGNTTQLGKALGEGDLDRAATVGGLVVLFVAGAALGSVLAEWSGLWRTTVVMAAVTALLGLASWLPGGSTAAMVLAMGAFNAAMSRIGHHAISLTYVTGTLVKVGQGLGKRLCGGGGGWFWTLQGLMWLGLLAGVIAGSLAQVRWSAAGSWPLAAVAAGLTVASAVLQLTAEPDVAPPDTV